MHDWLVRHGKAAPVVSTAPSSSGEADAPELGDSTETAEGAVAAEAAEGDEAVAAAEGDEAAAAVENGATVEAAVGGPITAEDGHAVAAVADGAAAEAAAEDRDTAEDGDAAAAVEGEGAAEGEGDAEASDGAPDAKGASASSPQPRSIAKPEKAVPSFAWLASMLDLDGDGLVCWIDFADWYLNVGAPACAESPGLAWLERQICRRARRASFLSSDELDAKRALLCQSRARAHIETLVLGAPPGTEAQLERRKRLRAVMDLQERQLLVRETEQRAEKKRALELRTRRGVGELERAARVARAHHRVLAAVSDGVPASQSKLARARHIFRLFDEVRVRVFYASERARAARTPSYLPCARVAGGYRRDRRVRPRAAAARVERVVLAG